MNFYSILPLHHYLNSITLVCKYLLKTLDTVCQYVNRDRMYLLWMHITGGAPIVGHTDISSGYRPETRLNYLYSVLMNYTMAFDDDEIIFI